MKTARTALSRGLLGALLPCSGVADGGLFRSWQEREPRKLPRPGVLQMLGVNTGGWLEAGITANGEDLADRSNGPALANLPEANLVVRPEARWDWCDGPANPSGPYPLPLDAGNKRDPFAPACDLIVTF